MCQARSNIKSRQWWDKKDNDNEKLRVISSEFFCSYWCVQRADLKPTEAGSHAEDSVGYIWQGFEGGFRKKVPLKEANVCILQPVIFVGCFNAFGNDVDGQAFADLRDAVEDALFHIILMDACDQFSVEFDKVRLILHQQGQSGMTRAEVVDGGFESEILYDLQVFEQVAVVDQAFRFEHFKNDVLDGYAALYGGAEGGCDAHIHLVDAGGGHVEVQQAWYL